MGVEFDDTCICVTSSYVYVSHRHMYMCHIIICMCVTSSFVYVSHHHRFTWTRTWAWSLMIHVYVSHHHMCMCHIVICICVTSSYVCVSHHHLYMCHIIIGLLGHAHGRGV